MFDAESFIEESIEELKAKITQTAIIACSGGVDSTVAAVLAHRAGRFEFGEEINHSTGFIIQKPPTAEVKKGDTLVRFYFDYSPNEREINEISDCFKLCSSKPIIQSRLIKRVGARNEIDFWHLS